VNIDKQSVSSNNLLYKSIVYNKPSMPIMRTFSGLLLLLVATLSYGQKSSLPPLTLTSIIDSQRQDTTRQLLVFDQTFDGKNYWISGGYPVSMRAIIHKAWYVLDSVKLNISAKDKGVIETKLNETASQKMAQQAGIGLVEIEGKEHRNLRANNLNVDGETTREQIAVMIAAQVERIKNNTPEAEQEIYQFSDPYYYNGNKNALVMVLIAKPGAYDLYATPYSLVDNKWAKQGQHLLITQED
jgi:hypothetical protein